MKASRTRRSWDGSGARLFGLSSNGSEPGEARRTKAAYLAVLFLSSSTVLATNVSGTISSNTTWTPAGSPYIVTGNVTVASGVTLTVQDGVTVKFNAGMNFDVIGTLTAIGTAGTGIVFTSNQATQTPGYWSSLAFESTASSSQLAYVTVGYAGGSYNAAVRVISSAPTFSNVTVTQSSADGISVTGAGANPSFQSCSFVSNARYGVSLTSGGSAAINNTSFTSNGSYALLMDPTTVLGGLSGLSASSNGGNSFGIRPGTIASSATWHYAGIPYAVTGGVSVNNGGTLTVDPGTVVKFTYHAGSMTVNSGGRLNMVGTPSTGIVLTSEAGTPAPNDWAGITLNTGVGALATLAYATIAYGGFSSSNAGAVQVYSGSPLIDHVTFQSPGYAGISIPNGPGTPTITNCAFLGPAAGIQNFSTQTIAASFNYWNSITGPSGAGSGSGVYVSAKVTFEPWLTSAPSSPDWFTSSGLSNRTFNPSIGISQTVSFSTVSSGSWTAVWKDGSGNAIRTISGSGAAGAATWDGKSDSGVAQPNGTYSYTISATSGAGDVAAPIRGVSIINNALAFTLTTPTVSQPFFSPNADGMQDSTAVASTASFDGAAWTINVKNSSQATVRAYSGSGPSISCTWDGKDSSGVVQPDGLYTFAISATDGGAQTSASANATLDNTLPTVIVTAPAAGTLSNVYQNGSAAWAVVGTATDANFVRWTLDYGAGSSPATWSQLATATSPMTSGTFSTWQTYSTANGAYTLRLRSWDKAGNLATLTLPITLSNFQISINTRKFDASAAGSVTVTSVVPFSLTETVVWKKLATGASAFTQVSAPRSAGTFSDVWNGATVPDGPYYYYATVDDGTHTASIDGGVSGRFTDYRDVTSLSAAPFDPFNNQPMNFTYWNGDGASGTGVSYVTFYLGPAPLAHNCLPPNYCPIRHVFMQTGAHQFTWNGVDSTGTFRDDINTAAYDEDVDYPVGGVVVFGRMPQIANARVTPPMFGPMNGMQALSFTLSTYQSQPAAVTITFVSQSSLSTLRTMTMPSQPPGTVNVTWDGRADDGSLVAPGPYTINIQVTDAIGNVQGGQVLTRVEY